MRRVVLGRSLAVIYLLVWLPGPMSWGQDLETAPETTSATYEPDELVEVELFGGWVQATIVREAKEGSYRVLIPHEGKLAERSIPVSKIRRFGTQVFKPISQLRKWTDRSGRHSIDARLLSLEDGAVKLLRVNGNVVSVPVAKLSVADQRLARLLQRRADERQAARNATDQTGGAAPRGERRGREGEERGERSTRVRPPAADTESPQGEIGRHGREPGRGHSDRHAARAAESEDAIPDQASGHGAGEPELPVADEMDSSPPTDRPPDRDLEAAQPPTDDASVAPQFHPEPQWGPGVSWQFTPDPREGPAELAPFVDFASEQSLPTPESTRFWLAPELGQIIVGFPDPQGTRLQFLDYAYGTAAASRLLPSRENILDFGLDGEYLLTSSLDENGQTVISKWVFSDRGPSLMETIPVGQSGEITRGIKIDSTRMLSTVGDRVMCINLTAGEADPIVYRGPINAGSWTTNFKRTHAFVSLPNGIAVIESATGIQRAWINNDESSAVETLATHPDDSQLAALSGSRLRIWSLATGQLTATIELPAPPAESSLGWGQGPYILVGNSVLYSVNTGRPLLQLREETSGQAPSATMAFGRLWYLTPVSTAEFDGLRLVSVVLPPSDVDQNLAVEGADESMEPRTISLGPDGISSSQ